MDNNELQRLRRLQQYIEDNESNRSIGLNSNHYVFKLNCQKIRQVINVIDIIVTLLERLNTEYDDKVYIEDIRVWINPNENHNSEDGIPIWFAYPTNYHNQSDCNDIFREEWGIDPVPLILINLKIGYFGVLNLIVHANQYVILMLLLIIIKYLFVNKFDIKIIKYFFLNEHYI